MAVAFAFPLPVPFDFHDSEVRAIDTGGGTLRLHFSAAHVRPPGAAGGFLKPVELALTQARWPADVPRGGGRLVEGRLGAEGRDPGPPTIPFDAGPGATLQLRFADGRLVDVRGERLTIGAPADARFSEDFSC